MCSAHSCRSACAALQAHRRVAATSWTRTILAPRCDREQSRREARGEALVRPAGPVIAPSVDLRDQPASTGRPSAANPVEAAQQLEIVRHGLAEAEARVDDDALARDAARLRRRDALARGTRRPRRPRRRSSGSRCIVRGLALHVHEAHGGSRRPRPPRARPGAVSAPMSLIIDAPAAIAARITSGLARVDRDRHGAVAQALEHRQHARDSSSSRRHAAGAGTARLARRCRGCRRPPRSAGVACASAACGSRKRPPSENESGVTLTTPMTSGRVEVEREAAAAQDALDRGYRAIASTRLAAGVAAAPRRCRSAAAAAAPGPAWAAAAACRP